METYDDGLNHLRVKRTSESINSEIASIKAVIATVENLKGSQSPVHQRIVWNAGFGSTAESYKIAMDETLTYLEELFQSGTTDSSRADNE
jgi:hypothetical protein